VLAGTGAAGSADGQGTAASFGLGGAFLGALCVDAPSGNLLVLDGFAKSVRRVTPSGAVTTLVPATAFAAASRLYDAALYVSFLYGAQVWVLTSAGVGAFNAPAFLAGGGGAFTATMNGATGSTDGTGAAARFNRPNGLAVDADGNVWVADQNSMKVRIVTLAGAVFTPAPAAAFGNTRSVVVAPATGVVYVMDGYLVHAVSRVYAPPPPSPPPPTPPSPPPPLPEWPQV
jgi:hypothetical protein